MIILNKSRVYKRHWVGTREDALRIVEAVETDIFIENAPEIPEGMIRPKLSDDNKTWLESAPQSEVDALKAEQALSQCVAKRKARYKEESDSLYLDIAYDAEKTGVKPDLTAWVALKDKIKTEIPKP